MERIFGALLTAALATTMFAAPQATAGGHDSQTQTETGKKAGKKHSKKKVSKQAKAPETK